MDTIDPELIAALISEDPDDVKQYYAAVAVVQQGSGSGTRWLLGLSKSEDDRHDRWCFPGGGIKSGEDPERAAARECREETGVSCEPAGRAVAGKPGVAFVRCRSVGGKLKPNHEFSALGWFTRAEMKSLKLYGNVHRIIDKVT